MSVPENDRQKKRSGARTRATAALAAALVLLSVCLVGMPTASSLAARSLPVLPLEAMGTTYGPKGALGIRNVPVFDSASAPLILRTGEGLDDPNRVYSAAGAILAQIGFPVLVDGLWSALQQEQSALPGHDRLPYDYALTEEALAPVLVPQVLASEEGQLNQLASLMFLASAHSDPGISTAVAHGAAAAYVIWAKIAQTRPNCDTKLNLAVLVAMGQSTSLATIDSIFTEATTSCQADPTLMWYWAMVTASTDPFRQWNFTIDERYQHSKQIIARMATIDSPLANAALGFLELTMSGPPFVARSHGSQAAQYFKDSLSQVDDPLSRWGLANALAQQGLYAEAVAQSREIMSVSFPWNVVPSIVSWAERSGDLRFGSHAADLLTSDTSVRHSAPTVAFEWAPVSLTTTNVTYVWDATAAGEGGAGGHDLWIIPFTRASSVYVGVVCPDVSQAMMRVLAGQADRSARDGGVNDAWYCNREVLAVMQEVELGDLAAARRLLSQSQSASAVLEAAQDRWRFSKQWSQAASITALWREVDPLDPAGWDRSGEVAFNQGQFESARRFFQQAAALLAKSQNGNDILFDGDSQFDADQQRAIEAIKLGVADMRLGDTVRANQLFSEATLVKEAYGAVVAHSAWTQLGDLDMAANDWNAAITAYSNAIGLIQAPFGGSDGEGNSYVWATNAHGMQENNLALALYKVGRTAEAEVMAQEALEWDPANPLYLDTAAFVLQGTAHESDAIGLYRTAVQFDPTLFEAWNNLGVLLLRSGDVPGAVAAFRTAVGLRPQYASGWHNLGAALSMQRTIQGFVQSQGALARATLLDRAYGDRDLSVSFDEMIYDSGLDVSKPIPAEWALATSAKETGQAFTWIMGILLGLSLVAAAFKDQLSDKVREGLVTQAKKLKLRIPLRLPVVAGVLAAVVIQLWCLPSGGPSGLWWMLSIGLGTTGIVGLVPALRAVVGTRADTEVDQFSWSPFLAVSVVGGLLGLGFSPMSAMTEEPDAPRMVRVWGLLGLAGGVCVALGSTWISGNPLVRQLAFVGIASWSAQVFPLSPMDGAYLSKRWNVALTLVAAGCSLLFVFPLL
jgi:tetratricopeptide (TPR) repeat protein